MPVDTIGITKQAKAVRRTDMAGCGGTAIVASYRHGIMGVEYTDCPGCDDCQPKYSIVISEAMKPDEVMLVNKKADVELEAVKLVNVRQPKCKACNDTGDLPAFIAGHHPFNICPCQPKEGEDE